MPNDLSRRGLLGLMAAAPVAAVAKPETPVRGVTTLNVAFDREALREMIDGINQAAADTKALIEMERGEQLDIWSPKECRAVLHDDNVKDFNTREHCMDHPPSGLSHPSADDEGPGAPAKTQPQGGCPPACVAAPSGAPGPDISPSDARGGGLPERSPGSPAFQNRAASDSDLSAEALAKADHPVLKYARAC